MRDELIEAVRKLLAQTGWLVSERSELPPMSFDLVARRDGDLVLVKVLTNVDSLAPAVAQELTILARFLEGAPLLVGHRTSSRDLEPGVVYARHGVPIVTLGTLQELLLEGVQPLIYAAPGGFYVSLDGEALRTLRRERGLSLGELAKAAGVSRRAIGMYEDGMGAMVEVAAKLEEFLAAPVVEPIDPLEPLRDDPEVPALDLDAFGDILEREIYRLMQRVGYQVVPLGRSPFNAIGREDGQSVLLTGVSAMEPRLVRRARAMATVCRITERAGAVFVDERRSRENVEGTALITLRELADLDDPQAILDLILERSA